MRWKNKLILFLFITVLVVFTIACEKEGAAEKAGKKIDKAIKELQK